MLKNIKVYHIFLMLLLATVGVMYALVPDDHTGHAHSTPVGSLPTLDKLVELKTKHNPELVTTTPTVSTTTSSL